ncbi:hypothetical protein ACFSTC_35310 [Nonomuraea ferruginea]
MRLTIDRDIQWAAQKAIGEQVESAGASSGTVIVMDVRTADVIAMANAPELDLANWREAPRVSLPQPRRRRRVRARQHQQGDHRRGRAGGRRGRLRHGLPRQGQHPVLRPGAA